MQPHIQYLQIKNIFPNGQCWKQKSIISCSTNLIKKIGKTNIILRRWTKFTIDKTLFFLVHQRKIYWILQRYVDYHIETDRKNEIEYLYIISIVSNEKRILKRLHALFFGLYYTHIRVIEAYATMNLKFINPNIFVIWHIIDWIIQNP